MLRREEEGGFLDEAVRAYEELGALKHADIIRRLRPVFCGRNNERITPAESSTALVRPRREPCDANRYA